MLRDGADHLSASTRAVLDLYFEVGGSYQFLNQKKLAETLAPLAQCVPIVCFFGFFVKFRFSLRFKNRVLM